MEQVLKHKINCFLAALILLFAGCKKDPLIPPGPDFVEGEILVGLYDTVSLRTFVRLIDSVGLKIKVAYGFKYQVKLPKDSVDTLKQIMESKIYFPRNRQPLGYLYRNDTLLISASFYYFTAEEAKNWFSTAQQLHLREVHPFDSYKWGILDVSKGQEKYWVNKLKSLSLITFSELNAISYNPYH